MGPLQRSRAKRTVGWVGRVTAPLAWADPAFNATADWEERHPWVWLPISPPDRRKPLGPREHAWMVGMSLAYSVAFEAVVAARGTRSTGVALQVERAVCVVLTVVLWVATMGAWERRAAALRPWWARR